MHEVITESTFEEFEKEKLKIKGEITADLDSPRAIAMDAYCRAMLENLSCIVGALEKQEIMPQIEQTIGTLPASIDNNFRIEKPILQSKKEVTNTKPDLNQAHIIKGWQVETLGEDDFEPLVLLNVILGASGLSSRLFLELRDKKGLAYVVRSTYETFKTTGNFMIYIATEPNNIGVSLMRNITLLANTHFCKKLTSSRLVLSQNITL